MKIWVDDIRPAPEGWVWCKTSNETIKKICFSWGRDDVTDISIDHDAGDKVTWGGHYIHVLNWMDYMCNGEFAENFRKKIDPIRFHLHSDYSVGVDAMRKIIQKNGWTEVK